MIKVFYDKRCSSCKNTIAWLEWQHLRYEKADIKKDEIKTSELMKILSLTNHGVSDLISTRGKVFRNLTIDLEQLKLNEFIQMVEGNRQLLRHPILFDHSCVQIGSSMEEMRCFIPKLQIEPQNF